MRPSIFKTFLEGYNPSELTYWSMLVKSWAKILSVLTGHGVIVNRIGLWMVFDTFSLTEIKTYNFSEVSLLIFGFDPLLA